MYYESGVSIDAIIKNCKKRNIDFDSFMNFWRESCKNDENRYLTNSGKVDLNRIFNDYISDSLNSYFDY